MAYAALVSLAQVLEQILGHDQCCNLLHEKQQIQSLRDNIIFLFNFLDDFPGEAGNLEARITAAANQAEDIIEYHISNEIRSEYGCCNILDCFQQFILSLQLAVFAAHQSTELKHHNWPRLYRELHESVKAINPILKEVMQIKSNSRNKDVMSSHSSDSSSSRAASKGKDTVVGFENELMDIKERLCGESSKLQIIPIFGMGGIGKTTLARYAHDDPLVVHHFDVRAWVTVSQDYRVRRVLSGLLCSINASNKELYEGMSYELLAEYLYKYLKGRRYLIVMDDVWNTNVWDDVRRLFPDDFNGSRIIITTRELDVASYVDSSSHSHEMHLMDVDRSWNLLREKVFEGECCPPELRKSES